MIEMSHTEEEVFHYLWIELNPSGIATWLITLFIACSSFYTVRLLLPQLNNIWEEVNTIPEKGNHE